MKPLKREVAVWLGVLLTIIGYEDGDDKEKIRRVNSGVRDDNDSSVDINIQSTLHAHNII